MRETSGDYSQGGNVVKGEASSRRYGKSRIVERLWLSCLRVRTARGLSEHRACWSQLDRDLDALLDNQVLECRRCCFSKVGHIAINVLRRTLERAYLAVRVRCPVAFSLVSGVAASRIRWKREGSRDGGVSQPTESRGNETRQGATMAPRRHRSGKSRDTRHSLLFDFY